MDIFFNRPTFAFGNSTYPNGGSYGPLHRQYIGMMLVHKGKAHVKVDNKTHKISSGHAETNLMRQASKKYDSDILSTCTLFTSTEPCAMCAGAIYWGGVQKVIFGCSMERYIKIAGNSLDILCLDVLASTNIDIIGPILEEEAVKVHKDYW